MPTYEYACRECGQHTEAVQAFTDDPLTVCPNCGGPLRKVFGNIGISFKGSGFYKNDSRSSSSSSSTNGSSKSDSSGDSSAKSDAATTSSPKSDSAATSDSGAAKSDSAKPAAAAS